MSKSVIHDFSLAFRAGFIDDDIVYPVRSPSGKNPRGVRGQPKFEFWEFNFGLGNPSRKSIVYKKSLICRKIFYVLNAGSKQI
jgi:hypothetical protein